MKKYELSDSDVKAILCALEVLPSYDFAPDFAADLVASVGFKLTHRKPLTKREEYLFAVSIDCAFLALRDELNASEETLSALRPYLFTINKLHPYVLPILNRPV